MNLVMFTWLAALCGLIVPSFLPTCPNWRVCLLLAGLLCLVVRRVPVRWRMLLPVAIGLLLGVAYTSGRAEWRMATSLAPAWEGKPVELTGVVRGLADKRDWGSRFAFEVESIETADARVPKQLLLSDSSRQAWPAGSRWRLTVVLKRPHGVLNPGGFDAEAWYWADGVLASGSVRKERMGLGSVDDFTSRVDRLREAAVQRWQQVLGETPEAALCAALTVGAQQALPAEVWGQLSRTGLTHLISVSGVHITLLAALVAKLATMLARWRPHSRWPPRLLGAAVGLFAAATYALLAGFTVPTQRSLYMLGTVVLALACRRSFSVLQIWLGALTLVLVIDPFAVLAPGFWLSFGLVGLLVMSGAGRRQRPGKVAENFGGQWTATLGSIAPLAGFFGALPLISPLANAVAIPLVSAVLTPLALVALLLPFDFGLRWAGWLAHQCLTGLDYLAAAPAFVLPLLPWPLLWLAGIGTLWALLPKGVPGRYCGLACLLPVLLYTPPHPFPGVFRATMIDVGQGLALLVETTEHSLLFDTGASEAGRTLSPVLQARGITRLDRLVLSHHDSDHDGGAASLLNAWPVGEIWLSQPESVPESLQSTAHLCRAGPQWEWDGVRFAWLAPFGDEPDGDDNNKSCVLRIVDRSGAALLVSGDLPVRGEARLLEAYPAAALRSDLLISPHHGSLTSSSEAFLAEVAPRAVWVSAGYRNRYHHPHPKVLARYREASSAVWRTDRDGALTACSSDFGHTQTQALRQARFWRWVRNDALAPPAETGVADFANVCR